MGRRRFGTPSVGTCGAWCYPDAVTGDRVASRPAIVALMSVLLLQGCVYRIGSKMTDGILDQAIGPDRKGGVEDLGDKILEKQLAAELGHQLGTGLTSGATDLSPEDRKKLEDTIDGLLTVATTRAGTGIRRDISPAMRDMVREDIIDALVQGMHDKVSPELESTADRVVTSAVVSLRRGLDDPQTKEVLSELIADSFYTAMREGGRTSPSVSDTLETTLTQNLLSPMESSAGQIADTVSLKVEEQARRTENTLRAIIVFLGVVLGAFMLIFAFVQRQLVKERAQSREVEVGLRQVTAAIGVLDEESRKKVMGVLDEGAAARVKAAPAASERRDDYVRKDKK